MYQKQAKKVSDQNQNMNNFLNNQWRIQASYKKGSSMSLQNADIVPLTPILSIKKSSHTGRRHLEDCLWFWKRKQQNK